MKHGDGGKGDGQRPGKGYQEGHERIYGEQKRARWIPPPLPALPAKAPQPTHKDKTP